jgi:hypothetical protein
MTDIEEVVRRALGEQVHRQPGMTGPADRAIAGARAVRRRQAALGVGAVVLVLVAAVAGVAALRDRGTGPAVTPSTGRPSASPVPQPSQSPSAAATGPALPKVGLSAVVGADHLLMPDGRLVSLAQIAGDQGFVRAYQVHDGWLVETLGAAPPDGASLWLFRADGTTRRLIDNADGGLIVAPDGRLAWRASDHLYIGHLDSAGNLVQDASTPISGRGNPQAFAGAALVIGYTATGGGVDQWDVWVPQRGAYTPSWDTVTANGVVSVFGATADGRYAIGVALSSPGSGSKNSCLARFDPMNTMRVVARACDVPEPRDWASISPDGHWMAYNSSGPGGATQTTVVDLTTVFQHQQPAATWPNAFGGVWTAPDTFVAPDPAASGRFDRYRVGQSTGEQVEILGAPPIDPLTLVPKLS